MTLQDDLAGEKCVYCGQPAVDFDFEDTTTGVFPGLHSSVEVAVCDNHRLPPLDQQRQEAAADPNRAEQGRAMVEHILAYIHRAERN